MHYTCETVNYGKYDLVVAGGGPAGIGAAIAGAKNGLKVLIIEFNGCLGGTSTSGALPFMLGATNGSIPFSKMIERNLKYSELPHPRKAVGGIFDMLVERIKSEGGVGPAKLAQTDRYPGLDRLGCHDEFTFDLEVGKRVYDEIMSELICQHIFISQKNKNSRHGRPILYLCCKVLAKH